MQLTTLKDKRRKRRRDLRGKRIPVTDQQTGIAGVMVVYRKRRGCKTVRRICIVCKSSVIRKGDAQYEGRVCLKCDSSASVPTEEPGLRAARTPRQPAPASPPQVPSALGASAGLGVDRVDLLVDRWRSEENARKGLGKGYRETRKAQWITRETHQQLDEMFERASRHVAGSKYERFIRSIHGQFTSKGYLTQRQYAALKRMAKPRLDARAVYPRVSYLRGGE